MSRSGVVVADEAIEAFNELKQAKSKVKYVIYKLSENLKSIVVDKKSSDTQYDDFVNDLPEDDCRYAVYDFEYETQSGEGIRNKLIFISWSPDTAKVKSKMVYASSKDAIRRSLPGITNEIQGTDLDEIAYDTVLERVSRSAGSH
ncbi:uncharacterized protein SAPINGB_P003644 [Magnusiomyces paraingens]|uniref:Cofilin n=1 Tax=Magnusiomyces paraingens TaxID=2606893 RepID=A0A5E8BVT4_9ASCO|nr:uncharacterized protein SAPINGB_P003644 [Saprochaete ingens]VVT53577.1 unnamed protein product [Saprochaete ingens]